MPILKIYTQCSNLKILSFLFRNIAVYTTAELTSFCLFMWCETALVLHIYEFAHYITFKKSNKKVRPNEWQNEWINESKDELDTLLEAWKESWTVKSRS